VQLVEHIAQNGNTPGIPARSDHHRRGSTPFRFSLLEVAAGSGYVPRVAKERLAARGIALDFTLLDRAASHVGNGGRSVAGDALHLPFGDDCFDLISSTLFAHHLCPEDFVQFVNESLRVCRVAVLINDLIRSPLHLALVYSGFPLYRSRLTRNDAPASVRQAYTQELLRRTHAARLEIRSYYLYRMGVIAWKK
jgi:ubiquinone/menaquinone biosynthesis C-methylase UbiE